MKLKENCLLYIVALFCTIPLNSLAYNQWVNEKKSGNPMTISEQGNFLLEITYAVDKYENIYLYPLYNDEICKNKSYQPRQARSAYFNGVLVQLWDACNGESHYYYPATTQGRNYIFNQFFTKNLIRIEQGNYKEDISGQGFTKTIKIFRKTNNLTGGL